MKLRNYKHLLRLLICKPIAGLLFVVYVKNNSFLIEDIVSNIRHRRNKEVTNLKNDFRYLLIHYSDFAFIFFWRIKSRFFLYKWLFYPKSSFCKIFRSTKLEGGVVCYHPYATVINAKSIGNNFIFRNGLTIGNKNNDNGQLPVIGNNVEVGANVVIIGDIYVGDNVIVGAGSVVVKSIPSNSVVVGNPARIIKKIN